MIFIYKMPKDEDYEPEPQPYEQWLAENPNDPEAISYIRDEA